MQGKNKIVLNLNKNFYKLSAIKEASKDFKGICSSKIKNGVDYIEIVLKPKDKKARQILGHEFYNYVLGLMKNKA